MSSKMWSRSRPTGYNGLFGDSFFSDAWDIMDRPISSLSNRSPSSPVGRNSKIIQEDVTTDVPEEKVKPMFRKSHLSRLSSDDIYQVMLEVSHFAPSDLTVKLVDDKIVTVEGKHGERKDPQGFVSREFTRKYNLPPSVKPSSVECYLSADGVLVIRGHADRPSTPSSIPGTSSIGGATGHQNGHFDHSVIPIFTQGYHQRTTSQSSEHQSSSKIAERIIPISLEDRYEVTEPSGRSSRSSTREPTTNYNYSPFVELSSNNKNLASRFERAEQQKERTVSFSEEEVESISIDQSHKAATTSKMSQGSTTRATTIPLDTSTATTTSSSTPTTAPRQSEQITTEEIKSGGGGNSHFSEEEREIRSPSRNSFPMHIDEESGVEEVFPHTTNGNTTIRNPFDTTTSSSSLMDRRRHFSSTNSINKDSLLDSNTFFSSRIGGVGHFDRLIPSFSTRGEHHDNIFDNFGDLLTNSHSKWSEFSTPPPGTPVQNREEKYEKTFEKGVKNGQLTETVAERFYSEQYSSSSFNKMIKDNETSFKNHLDGSHPLEHRINISSPA